MKLSHEEYLEAQLRSKKMELENLNILHRVALAVHETKQTNLHKEITSLEQQLGK